MVKKGDQHTPKPKSCHVLMTKKDYLLFKTKICPPILQYKVIAFAKILSLVPKGEACSQRTLIFFFKTVTLALWN